MSNRNHAPNRQPPGTPVGGQFALSPSAHIPAPQITLNDVSAQAPVPGGADSEGYFYVVIVSEVYQDLAVKYPTEEAAFHALNNSPLIDTFRTEDCIDVYVSSGAPNDALVVSPEECAGI